MKPMDTKIQGLGKFIKIIKRYLRIWFKTSAYSTQAHLSTRRASLMYIAGKFVRFFFFIWFLYLVGGKTQNVAGYSLNQMVTFFLIFNLFDITGQILFRGIYYLRGEIISGALDFKLAKPLNILFQVLTRQTDLLDLPLLLIILGLLWRQGLEVDLNRALLFGTMGMASLTLIIAIHTLIAAIGVLTTEVDNTIMIYRDLSVMARVPVDIYINPIRALLTFVIPVGVIMTFPAKVLLGLLSWQVAILSFLMSGVFLWISLRFWQFALTHYSSASS